MHGRRSKTVTQAGLLAIAGCLLIAAPARAVSPFSLYGRILGIVTDAGGTPQFGASVLLFDRNEKLVFRALTDDKGTFSFDNLMSGAYSVRVSLSSFVPAVRSNIQIQPGARNFLNVSLAGLFSSIELVYPSAQKRALMSDDWKWILRTSHDTRPVLRLLPSWDPLDGKAQGSSSSIFSDTRGLVKVSAGEGGRVTTFGNESDLGTAFALATSVYGANQVQLSGNFGYAAQSGLPSAGFRTSYSRGQSDYSPEVSLTMRQLFVPGRVMGGLGGAASLPAMRTMSLSVDDTLHLTDTFKFDYGFSLDSVAFFDRLNYVSPYGRLTYSLSDTDTIEAGFYSGMPRPEFGRQAGPADNTLGSGLSTLGLFPRVSLRDGRAHVQRSENFEIGYSKNIGSRTYRVAGYREGLSNAALIMGGATDLNAPGDVLPDLFTNSSVFNIGGFHTFGYMTSVTQHVGENLDVSLRYGSGGALLAPTQTLAQGTGEELRSLIHEGRRRAVTTEVTGTAPWTGTRFAASYQWTDRRTLTPTHFFLTQGMRAEAGLNFLVRQPIPTGSIFPVRMEASADLRNLLSQGYLPVTTPAGNRMYLMHTPRSVRGGLSFIF